MSEDYVELGLLAGAAEHRPGPRTGANRLLSALTASPTHANFRKLRSAVTRHRVIILKRGAVIAVSSLLSVCAALFLHALFAGVFLWSALFPWAHPHGDGKARVGDPDSGGAPIALLPSEDIAPGISEGTPLDQPALGAPAPAPSLAALPPLPELPHAAASADLASGAPLAVLLPDPLGSVKVATPAPVSRAIAQQVTSNANAKPTAGTGVAMADVGRGGFADEPRVSLGKGGGTGRGRGTGNGFGNGINRGLSAADRPPQQIGSIAAGEIALPLKYQFNLPEKPVELKLTIHADGTIGDITVEESCGVAELDELVRDYARTLRWSPAYHDGKAITADTPWGYSFRPFD